MSTDLPQPIIVSTRMYSKMKELGLISDPPREPLPELHTGRVSEPKEIDKEQMKVIFANYNHEKKRALTKKRKAQRNARKNNR
jgi:hypothetical protein